ncbi:ACP S-malonyltransferase [Alphaproteobacteria bacterium]|nr:ACP S-malonyltransferase [Alphaproteobacteria bacterium]
MTKKHRAMVFPGQGSQHVGMGKGLAKNYAVARDVFEEVDEALGEPLFELICDGPEDKLVLTRNAQPALMAVSLAVVRVLESESGKKLKELVDYVAGHSLGEYSALAAVNSISLSETAKLLRLRGESMQKAVPLGEGAMAALLGADMDVAGDIIKVASEEGVCDVANDNAPGQIVISGQTKAITKAISIAPEFGVKKAIRLPVSAPFHCSMMEPAAHVMAGALEATKIYLPDVPLVTNVSASAMIGQPSEICDSLVKQVTSLVRWRESIIWMSKRQISLFIEVGAGKVLTGLNKRIDKNFTTLSLGDTDSVIKFLTQIDC